MGKQSMFTAGSITVSQDNQTHYLTTTVRESGSFSINLNFAIVLAAGTSTRMGSCKTSLRWGESETLLTYQLKQWFSVGFTPVVVLGSHNSDKQKDCPLGSLAVINPHANVGKTTSL